MKIEIRYETPINIEINSREIPRGFFTGTIGIHTGLFFRSEYDIVLLSNGVGLPHYWGYRVGEKGCVINNYNPVDVEIKVK